MYTVIRFMAEAPLVLDLLRIGEQMNVVRPGSYDGPRRRGDGFACSISSSRQWEDHEQAIMDFGRTFDHSILRAVDLGARVVVDVAIEAEDRESLCVLAFDNGFLRWITSASVSLEISAYPG